MAPETHMPGDNKYRASDWRSLELHRFIAQKLSRDPDVLATALENIARWKAASDIDYTEWEVILASGVETVIGVLTGETQECARLRSSSPFAGVLAEEERDGIFRRWRAHADPARDDKAGEKDLHPGTMKMEVSEALALYEKGALTLASAARSAKMHLGDFMSLASSRGIPVLRGDQNTLEEDLRSFDEWQKRQR